MGRNKTDETNHHSLTSAPRENENEATNIEERRKKASPQGTGTSAQSQLIDGSPLATLPPSETVVAGVALEMEGDEELGTDRIEKSQLRAGSAATRGAKQQERKAFG